MTDTPLTMPIETNGPRSATASARSARSFRNDYWMKLDHAAEYPTAFVNALTEAGYLGCLIPEEYGGSGLPLSAGCAVLETIHETGCNAAACHAQMYTMGTVLKHGSEEQKRKLPAGDRLGQAPPAGVRRHRADDRLRHHPAQDAGREAAATSTWSTARRCGPAASCNPT